MGRVKYILPILCLIYNTHGLSRVPLVNTNVGAIRGLIAPEGYAMFLGIPYASVDPENPFGPSVPHPRFGTIFDAFDDSTLCPQPDEFTNTPVGTLDCLHLNVYAPEAATFGKPLPVMVWIHGGGFRNEYGGRVTNGPRFLLRHDVIVITLTYRVGPYGFLCLDTPEVPGNQGLKDQLLALRWIKNNIYAFGGDTDRITVFGQSAGALSADFHLIFSQEDLFNNIILQSGTSLTPFTFESSNPNAPIRLAEHLGYSTNDLNNALEFLKTVDTNLVIAASAEINLSLGPCIEKQFDNVQGLVTTHPLNMEVPRARNVSFLIGANDNELGSSSTVFIPMMFQNLILFLLADHFNFDREYLVKMERLVRRFYIGDQEITESVVPDLINFGADNFFHAAYRSMEKYRENGASNMYHYIFSYDGDRNFAKVKYNVPSVRGALHADELAYLFEVSLFTETPSREDQLIIDRITTLWTNFAKYSNPLPETTELLPVQWPVATRDTLYCLDINSDLSLLKRPFHNRMAFWDLFYKLNQSYLRGL